MSQTIIVLKRYASIGDALRVSRALQHLYDARQAVGPVTVSYEKRSSELVRSHLHEHCPIGTILVERENDS